jgi:small-conductance mechanosensitive channel
MEGIGGVFADWPITEWLERGREALGSREVLGLLAMQVGLIAAVLALAWGIRVATVGMTDRLAGHIDRYLHAGRLASDLRGLVMLGYAWLLLVIAKRVAARFGLDLNLVGIAASLVALWIVLRISTLLLRNEALARAVATGAWIVAALDITGLLDPTTSMLDSIALNLGTVRLSPLLVLKAALLIALLMWAALAIARLIGGRMERLAGVSPSVQALTRNLATIALMSLALLVGLSTVGIDLTALTVFSGAVGVGLGFGLQKIVSNFVSGIILLIERSVRPGDVIEVARTYGLVTSVGARYASVRGRDGKEYLIPNETLITNQVVNWSVGNSALRLDLSFAVPTSADIHEVRRFAVEAAQRTKRVVDVPAPVCHITEFGDNSINLLLRFWIEDPANGVRNIKGDVYLALWDAMREHGVSLPNPAREILIREIAIPQLEREPTRSAAE